MAAPGLGFSGEGALKQPLKALPRQVFVSGREPSIVAARYGRVCDER
jgi:hypothetical protein